MLDVIESTTPVAILNCCSRSWMPCRRAIHAKSVYAVHTSPFSSSITSNRTGQSSPEYGLDVMNWRAGLAAKHGVKVVYSPSDMSKADSIGTMMEFAKREFGGIDILVNNAGIQFVAPIDEIPLRNGTRSSPSNCHQCFI